MAKPKWLMRPVDIYKSPYGFFHPGEGVIYEYERREKYQDPRVSYFVVNYSPRIQSPVLIFESRFLSLDIIRRNVEINDSFSPSFKRFVVEYCFERVAENVANRKNVEKLVEILEELEKI